MERFWFFIALTFFACSAVFAQSVQEDPILFTVDGKPVYVSEFDYIYSKTNGSNADYTSASLNEYLDLYIKFKLKVQRARDMQLDTIVSLARELEDYKRQLADSYLIEREVTKKLVDEVYERKLTERQVSHIMFRYAQGIDSGIVMNKAKALLDLVLKGADFEDLAKGQSEDPNASENKGNLGFLTSMMPNGFYEFENAVYSTPVGKVHPNLVFSPMGIHIIKVTGERPARGEIEVAHILIRDPDNSPVFDAKEKIHEAYAALESGRRFEEVVKEYSEDRMTLAKGGYLGFFGINRYEKAFEDAAFSLEEDNAYSKPVKTTIGWHIIKRISKKDLEPFDVIKSRLQSQVKQDYRFEVGRMDMINRIKEYAGFEEHPMVFKAFKEQLDEDFLSYRWKPNAEQENQIMFSLGEDFKRTVDDFNEYLIRNQRKRLQLSRDSNIVETANFLYDDFISESCIKFEESRLEKKYPEFKSLMREYEEGILLFEATKMKVWDKASQDTVGLKVFHKANENKYTWKERAHVVYYSINNVDAKKAGKIYKYAMKKGQQKTLKKYNKKTPVVITNSQKYEIDAKDQMKDIPWQQGFATELQTTEDGKFSFAIVEELMPAMPKSLSEARGYIIADYQDYLEKQWVQSLRNEYEVVVYEAVLKNLIRS